MTSMIEKLLKSARDNPYKIAYKIDDEKITYKELYSKSLYYSNLLKREGNKPVILYGHKEINMIIGIISCILANRTYIPVELGTPSERIKEIMKISDASLVLTNHRIENIKTTRLSTLENYKDKSIIENDNDIVYIIFTSGSTGVPKGVPISKENLDNFVRWISHNSTLSKYKGIKVLNNASFSFDLSVADLFYSLCNGHTLVAYSFNVVNDYDKIFEVYKKERIVFSVLTPTIAKLTLLNPNFNANNYPYLECLYFCGEQLDKSLVNKIIGAFPKIKILNAYGPTEATSAVSMIRIKKNMLDKDYLPVGEVDKSATDIEIKSKEILLKGKSVFNGYLGMKSRNHYKENGVNCYKTGDVGFIDDNELYCLGRKDHQIKYKGFRIELGEIENQLKSINKVKDAIVLSKQNDLGVITTIKAYVITRLTEEEIKNELRKTLPYYMIPKSFVFLKRFPINKNGKVDRKELSKL